MAAPESTPEAPDTYTVVVVRWGEREGVGGLAYAGVFCESINTLRHASRVGSLI